MYAIKPHARTEVLLHTFLTLALDGGGLAFRTWPLYQRYMLYRQWVSTIANMHVYKEQKNRLLQSGYEPRTLLEAGP